MSHLGNIHIFIIFRSLLQYLFVNRLTLNHKLKICIKKYFSKGINMEKVLTGSGSKKYTLEKVIGQGSFGKVYLSGEYAVK